MNWVRTETFKIRGYEIGPDHRVPLQNLCGYMEEAAALHASELGFAVETLARRGLAWALTRIWIEFHELPCLGGAVPDEEESSLVRVKTWPVAVERLQYRRDFLISWRDRVLAKAASDWVVINLETRRAERIPEFISALQPRAPEKVMAGGRLKLPSQESGPELAAFTVRRADIDRNNHVNNARFTEWLVEATPAEISSSGQIRLLQIMYRAESRYGDVVVARGAREPESGAFLCGLYRRSDGRELVRARAVWN
ncbi:MAG: acyl-ACP thioesterase [Candidatus Adiutrix sp.]|jgi:fatty acyl-ACP thioesterase A|nr:acyl-ACP thioesterase [Candidatus Adiutrix sp.]